MEGPKAVSSMVFVLILLVSPLALAMSGGFQPQLGGHNASAATQSDLPRRAPAGSTAGAFSFVSNFEDRQFDGWTAVSGAASVTTKTTYSGEPSLKSSSGGAGPQVDVASQGFVTGDASISFQVAMSGAGTGYFGVGTSGSPVAVVGISNGRVQAGPDLNHLQDLGPIPNGNSYPVGWVYLLASVYDSNTNSAPGSGWAMQVFVDRTDQVAATITVPVAGSYNDALIDTTAGTVYYSDIVVSSYQIPTYLPGYNNMEGYGQGSGLLVNLLPAYYNLTAEMNLRSWNIPQVGILSFQINALNYYGTTRSTCGGFFQLGIDLNPNGHIAPWYVPGKNCVAHYFLNSNSPHIQQGTPSPAPTHLVLSIVYQMAAKQVIFTIRDTTTSQVFNASIPYSGDPFYGMYTQVEFQPCCNTSPIQDYQLSGSLYDVKITTLAGSTQGLPASYMLPFVLDAPPVWNFGYYLNSTFGYQQTT